MLSNYTVVWQKELPKDCYMDYVQAPDVVDSLKCFLYRVIHVIIHWAQMTGT